MAYWTIESSSFTATSGSATSEQDIELTITNIIDGVHSGYNIEAKNFKVGNGFQVGSPYTTGVEGSNEWVATGGVIWNADSQVSKVKFENNGSPGEPDNTVKATVTVSSFTPTDAATIYVDIDERSSEFPLIPSDGGQQNLCLHTNWPYSLNQTVTQTSLVSTVTSSDVDAGSSTTNTVKKLSGYLNGSDTTQVASVTFTANAGFHYSDNFLNSQFSDSSGGQPYTALFPGWHMSNTPSNITYNDSGLATAITFYISYTPPSGMGIEGVSLEASLGVSEANVCSLGHNWFTYINPVQDVSSELVNEITSITYNSNATHLGGSEQIKVYGTAGASYNISFQKKTSLTSSVTASTGGYYNFVTNSFQDGVYSLDTTVGLQGHTTHSAMLPQITSDTRYDITISGLVDGVFTQLSSTIPTTAGDATIIQQGVGTITITPITNTASNFGTLPANITVTKPKNFNKSGYVPGKTFSQTFRGGTSGASSTRLVLDKVGGLERITPGMLVTGTGVAHATTVVKVVSNAVTLSGASTIANNTPITIQDIQPLAAFSFTILPNSNTLNVNTSANLNSNVGGLSSVKTTVAITQAKNATHTLAATLGIVPGMTVTGSQVATDGDTPLLVSSVTNAATIVFDQIQSFIAGANLAFSNSNTISSGAALNSIQVNKVGSNIVITGYINITSVNETAQVRIYIDPLITVS